MSTIGREVIGHCSHNMLVADNKHPLDVCQVIIAAGAKHRKGEVLEIMEDGKCDILGTTDAENKAEKPEAGTATATAAYILAEDVDAEVEDTVGVAYRSGSFIRNALIVKEGYSLTDKDETALRNGGIYLSDAVL